MSDFPRPVVAVNGQDAYVGRNFTLVHELVHLALHPGGICNPVGDVGVGGAEAFCNAVAAAILVPLMHCLPTLGSAGPPP